MTHRQIHQMIDEANQLAWSTSITAHARAAVLLRRAEKALKEWRGFGVTCGACRREDRTWHATAVFGGRTWPLCGRPCVEYWKANKPGKVFMRGIEYQQRRAA